MTNNFGSTEMPLGFGMGLAMNVQAMEYFSSLPEAEQQAIINTAHNTHSKAQMQQLIESLANNAPRFF